MEHEIGDVGDVGVYIDRTAEFPKSPVAEKLKRSALRGRAAQILDKDNASDPDDPFAYGGCKDCDPRSRHRRSAGSASAESFGAKVALAGVDHGVARSGDRIARQAAGRMPGSAPRRDDDMPDVAAED